MKFLVDAQQSRDAGLGQAQKARSLCQREAATAHYGVDAVHGFGII